MKNICFLISSINQAGGTERVTSLVANELSKGNYKISILSLSNGGKSFFKLEKSIQLFSLYPETISMKKNYFGVILRIRKFVKQQHIDTLVVVDSISCIFTIPALLGVKINHISWEHFNFLNNNGKKLRDIARKWAVKYCNYVVTLTNKDKKMWEKNLSHIYAKIVTIPNPTPYENISYMPNLDCKTVLALGRLVHVKGYDLLLQAWALVCQKNDDWLLKIVGSGEEELLLKQQAQDLGVEQRVKFISQTQNVAEFYKLSAFFCLSSRFEGLPMVLLEAQAYGLPMIAFDCDTGPSDIIEHGKNGFLVESQNIEQLAQYLLEAINMDSKSYQLMSKNSKLNSNNFEIDNISKKWQEIL